MKIKTNNVGIPQFKWETSKCHCKKFKKMKTCITWRCIPPSYEEKLSKEEDQNRLAHQTIFDLRPYKEKLSKVSTAFSFSIRTSNTPKWYFGSVCVCVCVCVCLSLSLWSRNSTRSRLLCTYTAFEGRERSIANGAARCFLKRWYHSSPPRLCVCVCFCLSACVTRTDQIKEFWF